MIRFIFFIWIYNVSHELRQNAKRNFFVSKILHKWFVLYFHINLQRLNMNCARTHNDICSKILHKKFVLFLTCKFTTFKHELRQDAQRYFLFQKYYTNDLFYIFHTNLQRLNMNCARTHNDICFKKNITKMIIFIFFRNDC